MLQVIAFVSFIVFTKISVTVSVVIGSIKAYFNKMKRKIANKEQMQIEIGMHLNALFAEFNHVISEEQMTITLHPTFGKDRKNISLFSHQVNVSKFTQ